MSGEYTADGCTLPETVTFQIITSKIGFSDNLQNYVVSARRVLTQKLFWICINWFFRTWAVDVDHYQFVNFVFKEILPDDLEEDVKEIPSLIPDIPDDLFYPFRINSEAQRTLSFSLWAFLFSILIV